MICEVCGREIHGTPDMHHLDANRKNNSINNLIIICVKCHKAIHHPEMTVKNKFNFKELFLLKKYSNYLFQKKLERGNK